MDFSNLVDVEDPCAVCSERKKMACRVPECKHSFCFNCIKGVALQAKMQDVPNYCPLCRGHFEEEFLKNHTAQVSKFAIGESDGAPDDEDALEVKPDVAALQAEMRGEGGNGVIAPNIPSTSEASRRPNNQPMYWLYSGKDGWWKYEESVRALIEEKFLSGVNSFETYIMGTKYTIDFGDMVQYQTLDRNKMRAIKKCNRDQMRTTVVKGTAGAHLPAVFDIQ